MRVIIEKNYEELARWAARHVVETIKAFQPTAEKPFVLGLPTGSSPVGMYAEIVKAVKAGEISFKHVLTFNMDEYVGLPESHPESYHSFMAHNLFDHIDCPKDSDHRYPHRQLTLLRRRYERCACYCTHSGCRYRDGS